MQRRNLTACQKGFTTVELILAVALTAILTLAIYGAASAMRRSFAQNTANNYNLLAAKKGLSRIAEEIRYASNINTSVPGQTEFIVSGVTTKISFSNHTLKIEKPSGTTLIAQPFVQSVTFSPTNSRVTVTMVVQDASASHLANPTLTLSTTVRMLNVAEQ